MHGRIAREEANHYKHSIILSSKQVASAVLLPDDPLWHTQAADLQVFILVLVNIAGNSFHSFFNAGSPFPMVCYFAV
jgi:hypothetical protein